jgi:hypothetical protein
MPVFGLPVIEAGELANKLASAACATLGKESTDREWTTFVLDELRRIGKEEKKCVVSPDKENGDGAFLLDQVWWRNADQNDIALAVESEWGADRAVFHDFGKLLAIKAPTKLMVYGTSNHERESVKVRDGIEKRYMEKFTHHVAGEQYVLLEFAVPERSIYGYHFAVPADGQLRAV